MIHARITRPATSILLTVMLLAGCQVQPIRPASEVISQLPAKYDSLNDTASSAFNNHNNQWWQRYNDPQLNSLIEQVSTGNMDARISQARIALAQAGITASNNERAPRLYLNGAGIKENTSQPDSVKQMGQFDKQGGRAGLDFSWNIDIFGTERAANLASKNTYNASVWGKNATLMSIRQALVEHYITYQSTIVKQAIIQQLMQSQQHTLSAMQKRFAVGLASQFDVNNAQDALFDLTANYNALDAAKQAARYQIALMVGSTTPITLTASDSVLTNTTLWQNLPTGQPIDLLTRRPDIQAADAQLAAESAKLIQAKRSRLPKVFASIVYGGQDVQLSPFPLPLSAVSFLNAALSFAIPIYDNRFKAAVEAQTANESVATLEYDKAVLTAVYQVDSLLAARNSQRTGYKQLQALLATRQDNTNRARKLLSNGLTNTIMVEQSQRAVLAAQLQLTDISTEQARLTTRLFTALGGDWQDDPALLTLQRTSEPSPSLTPLPLAITQVAQ